MPSSQGVKPGDICPLFINSHSRENGIPGQIAQRDLFLCRLVAAIRSLEGPSQVLHPLCCIQCPVPVRCLLNALGDDCQLPAVRSWGSCLISLTFSVTVHKMQRGLVEFLRGRNQIMNINRWLIPVPSTWQVTDKWWLSHRGIEMDRKFIATLLVSVSEANLAQAP